MVLARSRQVRCEAACARLFALLWLILAVGVGLPAVAQASDPLGQEDLFATWARTAERAQAALRSDRASTSYLERLRDRLAEERSAASTLSQASDVTLRALQAEVDALGPAPPEGVEESASLAAQRDRLSERIAEANAPLITANGAFQRADVLIKELDRRIRDRQTADLLTRYPSPVFLHHWPESLAELSQWAGSLSAETVDRFADPGRRDTLSDGVPIAAALGVAGLLLLAYGLPAALRRLEILRSSTPEAVRQIWPTFAGGVLRGVVPAVAAICFILAWRTIAPASEGLRFLDGAGAEIAIDLILAYWLAHLVFSPTYPPHRLLGIDDRAATRGCQIVIGIGVISALEIVLDRLDRHGQLSPDALALLATPFMVAGGALFWWLAGVLRPQEAAPAGESAELAEPNDAVGEVSVGAQFLAFVRAGLKVLGVLIPLAALVGYVRLSRDAFDAAVQTIALLTIALVLFHVIIGLASLVMGRLTGDPAERKSLLPILVATVLGMALLPLLALVWGARATDIAEIWRLLSDGIQLGDTRISVDGFLTLILIFAVGLVATRWLQTALRTTVLPRTRLNIGARNAVSTAVGYIGITLAAVIAISSAGVDLSSLAIVAGALSVGIGFGMQTIVSNFVSGIILLIERPIKHGDWIEVSGFSGYVRKISVRSTRIETFDRHDVIIPNADLIANAVKNMTLTSASGRVIVPVMVAYGSDLERTKDIMLTASRNHGQVLRYPAPQILFMEMGDSGLVLELRGFLKDNNNVLSVRSDLMFEIYTNLQHAGIEIPFPQRDIHIRSAPPSTPEADATPPGSAGAGAVLALKGQP
jgi:small-conductance mechanosensitive channel